MDRIANNELTLDQIAWSEGDLHAWIRFARSLNSYEVMGGFDGCADLTI